MDIVKINNKNYEIVENIDNCFNLDEIIDKVTDYFDNYDAKKICETLFLDSDKPNDRFLIDEASIKY